MLCYYSRYSRY